MILGREDLKPFKAWFQKTLPLVYDDSLTYQELLYKLIAKINEVVESQNQTNENFDELLAGYLTESESRLATLKRQTDGKRGGRGGRRSLDGIKHCF